MSNVLFDEPGPKTIARRLDSARRKLASALF